MEANPYAAPSSEITLETAAVRQKFYVVSPLKLFLLYFSTFGIYQIYWHYKNWAMLKQSRRSDEWPVMRAIFSIFFVHALFREVDVELIKTHNKYSWNSGLNATAIVVLLIFERIMSRITGINEETSIWDALAILTIPVLSYFYYQAQKAINEASGDSQGLSNSHFSIGNIIWIALGSLFVLLILLSIVLIALVPEP